MLKVREEVLEVYPVLFHPVITKEQPDAFIDHNARPVAPSAHCHLHERAS